jgi:predicted amidophosphoribosyltransferase
MRAAIHAAKYRGRKDLCEMFGAFLWDEFGEDLSTQALLKNIVWSVVPVPMNAHKRRTRGYNHADWIARGFLARADATAFIFSPKLLAHRGGTESQARTASRGARQKNILGAFTCPQKNAVSGASVIVLDDVVTTGATLREAARVLKNSGARRVVCIAVAH